MRVAFVTTRREFWRDRIFERDSSFDTSSSLRKWHVLRDAIEAGGGEFHTFDVYRARGERWDAAIVDDLTRGMARLLLTERIDPRRALALLWEPRVVRPAAWRWLRWYAPLLGAVGVTDRALAARGGPFAFVPLPQPALLVGDEWDWDALRARSRTRFAAMVRSDKTSTEPGELYSTRRSLIRYFERADPEAFDLYGFGWNEARDGSFSTPLYRGVATHQLDVFPDYRFAISIDNSAEPGLVTYDIFSALRVGTVPVVLGAPDLADFVAPDCYIDMRAYPTFEALHARLREVAAGPEWERYREAGARYLASDAARLFTADAFVERVLPILERIAG